MKTLYSRREESFFVSKPLIAEMQLQTVQLEMSRAKKKKKNWNHHIILCQEKEATFHHVKTDKQAQSLSHFSNSSIPHSTI